MALQRRIGVYVASHANVAWCCVAGRWISALVQICSKRVALANSAINQAIIEL